jgi:hypothetical protein
LKGLRRQNIIAIFFGNPKGIEDIEQWILQYHDELEGSRESTELK